MCLINFHYHFQPMESEPGTPFRPRSARLVAAATLPEVEFYFHLLVLIHLIDTECYNEVSFYQTTFFCTHQFESL